MNRAPGLRIQTTIVTTLKCVVCRLLEVVVVGVCVLFVESLLLVVTGGGLLLAVPRGGHLVGYGGRRWRRRSGEDCRLLRVCNYVILSSFTISAAVLILRSFQ